MEPAFCYREMTDCCLAHEVNYETGHRDGGCFTVYSWKRIWLHSHTDHELVVTLRRLRGQNVWRRVSAPKPLAGGEEHAG